MKKNLKDTYIIDDDCSLTLILFGLLHIRLLDAVGGELGEDGTLGTFEGEKPCEDGASRAFGN